VTGETLQTAKSPSRSHKNALKSAHFVLSDVPQVTPTIPILPTALPVVMSSNKLLMAIPKRLLKRAVDRNAVKRVCREAWASRCKTFSANSANVLFGVGKPKLIKLVNLPKFDSTTQLKSLMRADVDVLLIKMNKN
jgi:ribonuclease P protein component